VQTPANLGLRPDCGRRVRVEKTMHYPVLTELQLATKWNISKKTLGHWRATNQGPTWYKLFRHIRYHETDVIDFERRSTERLSAVLGRDISSNHLADTASTNAVTDPLVPNFEFQNKLVTSKEVAALTNLALHIFLDPKERDKKKIPAIKLIGIVRFSIDEIFRWKLENSTSKITSYFSWTGASMARIASSNKSDKAHNNHNYEKWQPLRPTR